MKSEKQGSVQNAAFVLHAIDFFISAIEMGCQFIEDNVVRPIIDLTMSALHVVSSLTRFMLDLVSENILNICLSCGQLVLSLFKLVNAFCSISADGERIANYFRPLHIGFSAAHAFFTTVHATTRGIQYAGQNSDNNSQSPKVKLG